MPAGRASPTGDAFAVYPASMPNLDDVLAAAFAAKRQQARVTLRGRMDRRGLLEKDGWRIDEAIRHREGRTELVLRPIHLRLPMPHDLECIVAIDEPGSNVTSDCEA